MSDSPKLVVLAGPNGAGKSFHVEAKSISILRDLNLQSFDYDIELSKLHERYASILNDQIAQNLEIRTKELFEEMAIRALEEKKNFSFQTNFDKVYTDRWREDFSNRGFETHLIFFYVSEVGICEERVVQRVQAGGHDVPKNQIGIRYKAGLQHFDDSFSKYDHVSVFDTSGYESNLLFKIKTAQLETVMPEFISITSKHDLEKTKAWIVETLKK